MKILNWLTEGHYCHGCGDFFPKSVLITLTGYESAGTYCTCCAQEVIEDEMEEA